MDTTTRDINRTGSQSFDKDKTQLGDDLKKVKDSISTAASHISDNASDLLKDAKEKTADIQDDVIKFVKENPVKSVGYALLAGFVAALILRK